MTVCGCPVISGGEFVSIELTWMPKGCRDEVVVPSLTAMTIPAYAPRWLSVGVPVRAPVTGFNVAHGGRLRSGEPAACLRRCRLRTAGTGTRRVAPISLGAVPEIVGPVLPRAEPSSTTTAYALTPSSLPPRLTAPLANALRNSRYAAVDVVSVSPVSVQSASQVGRVAACVSYATRTATSLLV